MAAASHLLPQDHPRRQPAGRALVTFAKRMPEDSNTQVLQINGGPGSVIFAARTPGLAITLHLVEEVI